MQVSSPPENLIIVIGDNEFLRAQAVSRLVAAERASRAGAEELTVERIAAGPDAVWELSEALSPALFGGGRIVVFTDAEQSTKDVVAAVLGYVASPDPEICLIVSHNGAGRAKALALDLQKAGALVERCPVVKSVEDRVKYVRKEAGDAGGKMDAKAAVLLVEAIGEDVRSLSGAARQLVADSGGTVNTATVHQFHRGRADVKSFAVADDAIVGRPDLALEKLRWALHDGLAEVLVADALAEGVRTVAQVASAGRVSSNVLASKLAMPYWKVDRAQKQAVGWSAQGLSQAMQIVATLNADVKGNAVSAAWALEKAVLDLSEARAME